MANGSTHKVFEVPPKVLSLAQVLSELASCDGRHLWVLGILAANADGWQLEDEGLRLRLDIGRAVAQTLSEPLAFYEGRRCAAQGALVASGKRPFLVVERVVTARALGIRVD